MIISKTVDDVEYPLNGHFRVIGYCEEKSKKQIQILNDNTYKVINAFLTLESLFMIGLTVYNYSIRQETRDPFILYLSLYFFAFMFTLYCSYNTIQNIKKLNNYLISHILSNFLALLASFLCLLPALINANAKGFHKFNHDRTLFMINSHRKYLIFMQCQVIAKLYGIVLYNSFNLENQQKTISALQWTQFGLLFIINMAIIQQILKLQFIIKFDRGNSYQLSSTQKDKMKVQSNKKQNSSLQMYLWQTLTYFESLIQMSQTLVFLLICVHNTLIATIVVVIWCLYSFFFCYQNVFELFHNKSGEINTSRSIFYGYRVDYIYGLFSQEFQQLKIYQNMSNYIKLAFVIIYKITIIAVSFLYFNQNKEFLNYFNIAIIVIDLILFFVKAPYYFLIFFKNSDFSFNVQLRPNGINSQGFSNVNKFNKFINIVIYNPIKEYNKSETAQMDEILASQDKMIYFEIYDQVKIYNKFGHLDVQIIKFSYPLYGWISTRVKDSSKSIRVQIFSIYNSKTNIISLIKDQLLQTVFDPTFKNNLSYEEIIANLPFSYFPRNSLKKLTIEYSKNKVFSQILAYQKHVSPLIYNNPQQVLYDLLEMN